ncbi:MAG: toprim domain-containing protein [Ruminococcus bromii]|uniref:DNA gyrase/topoisomerase IV subunit B n=1 Tax=Ruminococcus sp. YE282 TaxID=3158780 RepID=UPI000890F175|nr:toprim domain-containing protein [Ruminococcus bromii]MCI7210778.1 toprim domain-containing protein [Ruminococcus bromii]MDD6433776.1 toprim domain-containing protein [Ruminococcus bromii]MDY4711703.1 toprim domain-containing protein [Ruminococcus bromii]MEE0963824.1 toprim domain-containing protein [Ruminococcus bromii]
MPRKKQNEYDNSSITTLKGADRVRKRPAVIFGSDGIDGCEHSVFEILSNSIDEAREGYGKKISVTRFSDGSIEVEDHGRGIPVDFNEKEQRYNWELVFCEMYAGGKYNNNEGESYEFSLGMNGLGLCSTQYSSEYMDVDIRRDGYRYTLHFEKGENIGGLKKEPYSKKDTGTKITWKPDLEVFTDIDIQPEYFIDIMKRQAIVNAGVEFCFKNQNGKAFDTSTFNYVNGIVDHVAEVIGEDGLTSVQHWSTEVKTRDRDDKPEYKCKMDIAVAFSNKVSLTEYYHNSSWLEHGGAPDKAVRNAFVYQIDSYLKQNNKYNKTESKIKFDDVEDCLVCVISSFSSVSSYENQTKKAVTNKGIQDAMTAFLRQSLEIYFIENPLEAEKIAEQVLVNKRSRENAEKTRLNIKKKLSGNLGMADRVAKFVDCRSKDVERRELFIVEGDSALGACKQARDPDFQAIMPIRGKILNCLKADYDKIFKSEIITDLLKVLGCGVEVKSKANKNLSSFDMNLLRWNKIILCTDADVDGFHIRTMLLTMIYRLTPTLIEAGKVFIAESPLYEITSKNDVYFAYDEAEKDKFIEQIGKEKFTIQRSKGLGENEPDMMNLTTMNPSTRRLIKVMPDDMEQTVRIFDILLGDNMQGRKDYIVEHGSEYIDNLDVS